MMRDMSLLVDPVDANSVAGVFGSTVDGTGKSTLQTLINVGRVMNSTSNTKLKSQVVPLLKEKRQETSPLLPPVITVDSVFYIGNVQENKSIVNGKYVGIEKKTRVLENKCDYIRFYSLNGRNWMKTYRECVRLILLRMSFASIQVKIVDMQKGKAFCYVLYEGGLRFVGEDEINVNCVFEGVQRQENLSPRSRDHEDHTFPLYELSGESLVSAGYMRVPCRLSGTSVLAWVKRMQQRSNELTNEISITLKDMHGSLWKLCPFRSYDVNTINMIE
eukprot:3941838-Rhodomonas_salina.3